MEIFIFEKGCIIMKKIVSIVMSVILLLSLDSCKSPSNTVLTPTPTQSENTTPSKNNPFIPESLEGMDFGGEEINFIMCGNIDSARNIHLPEGDDETYSVNVCVAYRNREMEKELNLKIGKSITLPPEEMTEHMRLFFASPDSTYDIVGAYERYDLGLASGETGSNFIDYATIPEKDMHIDLDGGNWDKNSYEALSVNGNYYWVTGLASLERTKNTLVSFVNKTMWRENVDKINENLGYAEFQKLVDDGKWTYENAAKLGGIAAYELGNEKNTLASILMAGEGITLSKNGEPTLDADKLGAFADNLKTLFADNGLFKSGIFDETSASSEIEHFSNGEAFIAFGKIEDSEFLHRYMRDDYYIAPLPKSSESAPYRTSVQGNTNVFGILKTCENVGAATAALEVMAYNTSYSANYEYLSHCVRLCYCHDSDDMLYLALYSVYEVEYVTDLAISCEGMLEEKITDFINKNVHKDDFKSLLTDKKSSFDADFEKIKNKFLK